MCRGGEDGLIVLLFPASVDTGFAVLSTVQMWNKKTVHATGNLNLP